MSSTTTPSPSESIDSLKDALAEKERVITHLTSQVNTLQNALLNMNRHRFGSKRDLFVSHNQLMIPLVGEVETPKPKPEPDTTVEKITVPEHERTVPRGRKKISDVPRKQFIHETEQTHCSCCSGELAQLQPIVTEELYYQPAVIEVHEHIRTVKGCPRCKSKEAIVTAELPPEVQPFQGCRASRTLVAMIAVAKYVDAMPLYRLERKTRRLGFEIPRQRMCDWMRFLYEKLFPMYLLLGAEFLKAAYLQMDETWVRIHSGELTPGGAMKRGYLWAMWHPDGLVYFHYDKTRGQDVPKALLKGFEGAVGTDGYCGYTPLSLDPAIRRVPCLAHVRRKFTETQKLAPQEVAKILGIIKTIYKLEAAHKKAPPDERLQIRKTRQFGLFRKLYRYIRYLRDDIFTPQSPFMGALNYAWHLRYDMVNYFRSEEYHLDSNAIERMIRPIVIGRKNYMFHGSHDGAKWAAVIYTMLLNCQLQKVNPTHWLESVLVQLKTTPKQELHTLLPHNWQP